MMDDKKQDTYHDHEHDKTLWNITETGNKEDRTREWTWDPDGGEHEKKNENNN